MLLFHIHYRYRDKNERDACDLGKAQALAENDQPDDRSDHRLDRSQHRDPRGLGDFAYAAVEMINSLGIADYISFGAETEDIETLKKISGCLTNETASFKSALNDYLKAGNSFPKARSLALAQELGEDYATIMSTPNNILAIEYLSALTKLDSNIKPTAVKRIGAEHDSTATDDKYASGKLIRDSLKSGDTNISSFVTETINERPIFSSDIQSILNIELMKLQRSVDTSSEYSNILDITPDILSKLRNLSLPASYEDIISSLKSRELTRSRICRVLIHILLKDGYAYDPISGVIMLEPMKYLYNFIEMWPLLIIFLVGVALLLYGIIRTIMQSGFERGIWFVGIGVVMVVLVLFLIVGWNNTAYYPSNADLQSSLTIVNSSSSEFTLRTMFVVSLLVPFVLAYIVYAWRSIDKKKIDRSEISRGDVY